MKSPERHGFPSCGKIHPATDAVSLRTVHGLHADGTFAQKNTAKHLTE
jgi:hypothetical protein